MPGEQTNLAERVAVLEANFAALLQNVNRLIEAVTVQTSKVNDLTEQLVGVSTRLQHPSPDDCAYRTTIADYGRRHASAEDRLTKHEGLAGHVGTLATQHDHKARIEAMEQKWVRAETVWRVVGWLAGGGGLSGIVLLVLKILEMTKGGAP